MNRYVWALCCATVFCLSLSSVAHAVPGDVVGKCVFFDPATKQVADEVMEDGKTWLVFETRANVKKVWMNKYCGGAPSVTFIDGSTSYQVKEEGMGLGQAEKGWRIIISRPNSGKSLVKGAFLTPDGYTMFKINFLPSIEGLTKISEDAATKAELARKAAEKAEKEAKAHVKRVSFAFEFAGFISVWNPGPDAGKGFSLAFSAVLGRFQKDRLQIGVITRFSGHFFNERVMGVPVNREGEPVGDPDVNAMEWDLVPMFFLSYKPHWRVRFYGQFGFGGRVFTNPDTLSYQNQDLMIVGVSGRASMHLIFAAAVGMRFYPHKNFGFGFEWNTTAAVYPMQVKKPSVRGGDPLTDNGWNHNLSLILEFPF